MYEFQFIANIRISIVIRILEYLAVSSKYSNTYYIVRTE